MTVSDLFVFVEQAVQDGIAKGVKRAVSAVQTKQLFSKALVRIRICSGIAIERLNSIFS